MHTWTDKNGTQYSMSHVATTALLLSQNGLRSNLRASNFWKFSGGACSQTPLVLHAYACLYIHIITLLIKILARALLLLDFMSHKTSTHLPKQTAVPCPETAELCWSSWMFMSSSLTSSIVLSTIEIVSDGSQAGCSLQTCSPAYLLGSTVWDQNHEGHLWLKLSSEGTHGELQGPRTWHMLCLKLTIKCVYQASLIVYV